MPDKYFCWLVVHKKMPFDDCPLAELTEAKVAIGRFKKAFYFEDEEKMVCVVIGGSRMDFKEIQNKRIIELTTFVANLLIDMLNEK